MKKIIILCISILVFVACVSAQISDSFSLRINDLIIEQDGEYDILTAEGCYFTEEIGNPKLPVKIMSFVLPYESTVSGIDVTVSQKQVYGNYNIYPAQPPRPLDGSDPPAFAEQRIEVYGSNTPYPNKKVEIISDEYTHGYHVVTVAIYPVEYYPLNGTIYLRDIRFTINYTHVFDSNLSIPFTKQSNRRQELGRQFVASMVKNADDVENYRNQKIQTVSNTNRPNTGMSLKNSSVSTAETPIPDYIIITNNHLKPYFQPLTEWKTKKGIPAIIKTVEDIAPNYQGSDIQEKIRNYLKEAYNKYGASLFVLLGGDVNIIPGRLFRNTKFATDLYYATVNRTWNANNNDLFGESNDETDYGYDFFLGRASVEDTAEAQTFVNKVIHYEKQYNVGNSNYVNNFLCLVGFLNKNICGVYYSPYFKELKYIANNYMLPNMNKWFVFDNHNCQYNPTDPFQTPFAYKPHLTGTCNYSTNMILPGGGSCEPGDQELNKTNIISCLNNGTPDFGKFHIVYHIQHSNIKNMGTSKITGENLLNSDFDHLTNGNYSQILFSNGCNPASFNYDCIAEHYVNNSDGGGVAFIGNSDYGLYGDHVQFEYFCQTLYNSTTGNNIAIAFQNAASALYYDRKRRLTLLGDPEMPVWTATPAVLTATASLNSNMPTNGERSISVTISGLASGQKATVCLQKGEECYETRLVANGTHSFTFVPHTSGAVNITATAPNFKPWEWSTNVTVIRNINIANLTFDDNKTGVSNGNNDGQLDAGETIELTIQLRNTATANATNVSTTLTCNSQYITMVTGTSNFGTINAGATKNSPTKYVFSIAHDAPEVLMNELNQIKFTLEIDAAINGQVCALYDKFNIDVFAPELELGNQTIVSTSDGDKIIEPNETITINIDLFNKGKAQATGINAVLTTNDQNIAIASATSDYADIEKYETQINNSAYQFTIPSSYVTGQALNFTLQVVNEHEKIWNFPFNLLNRPEQIQVANMDFISDRTSIKVLWIPLGLSSSFKGYNIYRCDTDADGNPIGNYEKLNTFAFSSAFYNDENLTELTKYYYKVSAVSTEGNESELSDALLTWTSYPPAGPFPIQMDSDFGKSIISSVNLADINHDHLTEIFTAISLKDKEGYLIGLNADGTELFNIDGNQTSYSGFVKLDAGIASTPAVGDLKANGNYSVISMTRDQSANKINYFSSHATTDNDSDGIPDLEWQTSISNPCYRAPVLSNLDNSPDGSLETVFYTEWGGIKIYNAEGQLTHSFANNIGATYGSLAVADIDGDGDKEIIGCYENIYVWHHDGTSYNSTPHLYSLPDYRLGSSPVVCDIDNDGDKEILTSALKTDGNTTTKGRIVVIHHDGTVVNGWDGTQHISYSDNGTWHSQDISVGDLDNDGNIEVVALGKNMVNIWNKSGVQISSTTVNELEPGKLTPILADVDNDPDLEIIFGSNANGLINALNMDGSKVVGFPLHIDEALSGSPAVADVNNNGKNEIIAASGTKIYMWETNGNPQRIEWGSERHDSHNTGEYFKICPPVIIDSNTTWTDSIDICGDIIIKTGRLTIASTCTVTMAENAKILLLGGELNVDAGKILNTNVKALNESHITLKNNGYILISKTGKFNITAGATFEHQHGKINRTK